MLENCSVSTIFMVFSITTLLCSCITTDKQHQGTQQQTANMWLLNFVQIMRHVLIKAIMK